MNRSDGGGARRAWAITSPSLSFEFLDHPAGSGHFAKTRRGIVGNLFIADCRSSDAILLAAIELADVRRPEGTEVQPEIVFGLRRALDLYAAVRPIRLYDGAPTNLKSAGPGIDFVIVRENTEGLFSSFGGGAQVGDSVVADTMIVTRAGTQRISEFASSCGQRSGRPADGRRCVACVDKANVFRSLAFFRKISEEVAGGHPDIESKSIHIDAMTMYLVQRPWSFDVGMTQNMFWRHSF